MYIFCFIGLHVKWICRGACGVQEGSGAECMRGLVKKHLAGVLEVVMLMVACRVQGLCTATVMLVY